MSVRDGRLEAVLRYTLTPTAARAEEQFSQAKYLPGIELLTYKPGFCGSLDSSLYRLLDGVKTTTGIPFCNFSQASWLLRMKQ